MTLRESIEAIVRHAQRDLDESTSLDQIINLVLVDSRTAHLRSEREVAELREMGVTLAQLPLSRETDPTLHDPQLVSEALLSIV